MPDRVIAILYVIHRPIFLLYASWSSSCTKRTSQNSVKRKSDFAEISFQALG